jgi:hypothetical protein
MSLSIILTYIYKLKPRINPIRTHSLTLELYKA